MVDMMQTGGSLAEALEHARGSISGPERSESHRGATRPRRARHFRHAGTMPRSLRPWSHRRCRRGRRQRTLQLVPRLFVCAERAAARGAAEAAGADGSHRPERGGVGDGRADELLRQLRGVPRRPRRQRLARTGARPADPLRDDRHAEGPSPRGQGGRRGARRGARAAQQPAAPLRVGPQAAPPRRPLAANAAAEDTRLLGERGGAGGRRLLAAAGGAGGRGRQHGAL
eukprot:scaffold101403_cov62-Phaeocystis_antarctica.AAC.1